MVSGSSPEARYFPQTANLVLRAVWRVRVQIRDITHSESASLIEHKVFVRKSWGSKPPSRLYIVQSA